MEFSSNQFSSAMDSSIEVQHIFGNFRSYYSFHSVDARTNLFPVGTFLKIWQQKCRFDDQNTGIAPFFMCDVGCNEGDLTFATYLRARAELPSHVNITMVGLDLDPVLISRASSKSSSATPSSSDRIVFMTVDVMDNSNLASACASIIPSFADQPIAFDFISLYSVTMWIHLNHGDSGLSQFLENMASLTSSAGGLLVEPQDKKSYKTAAKRCRKMGLTPPPFTHQLDSHAVDQIAVSIESQLRPRFHSVEILGTEAWGRSLILLTR